MYIYISFKKSDWTYVSNIFVSEVVAVELN